MQTGNAKASLLLLFLFVGVALCTVAPVYGQTVFEVDSMMLTVYRDGLVHVEQNLTVDQMYPAIFLCLLSSSMENVIVLDENEIPVDYQMNGLNLTIFTLGSQQISIEYDTIALTGKEAEVWTFLVDNPYNSTVFLPKNSTLVFLSQMPNAINTEGNSMSLSLQPGKWELSYVLPLLPIDEEQNGENGSSPVVQMEILIGAIAAAATIIVLSVFILIRRRKPSVAKILKANPQLMTEDKDVLEFLVEKNGKAFEAEIRERFPDMPRTSLWRLVRRLERLEIVEVKKIGLENQVQLKK